MREGIIVKGLGGRYEVETAQGRLQCTLRGKLRLSVERVLVGDRVEVSVDSSGTAVVERILPRRNELVRPPVANIDQVLVVFAAQRPAPNLTLLDRILVQAELLGLESVVVVNKADLDRPGAQQLQSIYGAIPYRTIITSTKTLEGITELRQALQGKTSVLAGPSGVGKSSLLNALNPALRLETGEVSTKIQRGKHTTRRVELLAVDQGYVADTPGFSQLYLEPGQAERLQFAFPEFLRYREECRFRGCLHRQEPDCAVLKALERGEIAPSRHAHYLLFLEEVAPRY
ncbi:MAG TPA: ribosome small subunit-dependent GTPase A [Limnochordia bacterium]|nr:ribosome small subunit-dependent GTPase A [Limnochordia bacterium]